MKANLRPVRGATLAEAEALDGCRFSLGVAGKPDDRIVLFVDEETGAVDAVSPADYLYLLENGDPLRAIPASHPVEKTINECAPTVKRLVAEATVAYSRQDDALANAKIRQAARLMRDSLREKVPKSLRRFVVCEPTRGALPI